MLNYQRVDYYSLSLWRVPMDPAVDSEVEWDMTFGGLAVPAQEGV